MTKVKIKITKSAELRHVVDENNEDKYVVKIKTKIEFDLNKITEDVCKVLRYGSYLIKKNELPISFYSTEISTSLTLNIENFSYSKFIAITDEQEKYLIDFLRKVIRNYKKYNIMKTTEKTIEL